MNDLQLIVLVLFVLLFSLIAPLAWLAWVRKTERYHTEGWGTLLRAFAYGAFIGTFVSAILEGIFQAAYNVWIQPDLGLPSESVPQGQYLGLIVLAVFVAPFIEEGMKGLGVWSMRARIRYVADGLVFGSAVGFGFSFIENTLYGASAWTTGGFAALLATIIVRSISSSLLHGSATAMTGLGVAENQLQRGQGHKLAGYYSLAVLMHGSFNALASITVILALLGFAISTGESDTLSLLALVAAITFAFAAFGHVRTKITEMETQPIYRPPAPPQRTAPYAYTSTPAYRQR